MNAWPIPPVPVDEQTFTAHGRRGWTAWNDESPEVEVVEFLTGLVRIVRPSLIIETGVGNGFITRALMAAKPDDTQLACFESDDSWRHELADRFKTQGFDHELALLSPAPTPSDLWPEADLVILDSDPPWRFTELRDWATRGRPGSFCYVHDTGNGHGPGTEHDQIGATVRSLQVPGIWLPNPRGSWLGQLPR